MSPLKLRESVKDTQVRRACACARIVSLINGPSESAERTFYKRARMRVCSARPATTIIVFTQDARKERNVSYFACDDDENSPATTTGENNDASTYGGKEKRRINVIISYHRRRRRRPLVARVRNE